MSIWNLKMVRDVDRVSQFKKRQGKFMDCRSIKEMLLEEEGMYLLISLKW